MATPPLASCVVALWHAVSLPCSSGDRQDDGRQEVEDQRPPKSNEMAQCKLWPQQPQV